MVKTVVREHHWKPDVIDDLFSDDIDYRGLEFWYADVVQVSEELKKPKKKKE